MTALVGVGPLQAHPESEEAGLTDEAKIAERLGLSFEEFPIADHGVPESFEAAHALPTERRASSFPRRVDRSGN